MAGTMWCGYQKICYGRYQCGLGKKFLDPNTGELYPELEISCSWNRTWSDLGNRLVNGNSSSESVLHACVWVQCLDPPEVSCDLKLSYLWICVNLYESIFSLQQNSTWGQTGRGLRWSSTPTSTTAVPPLIFTLRRTLTNPLGKERFASQMEAGNLSMIGRSV